MCHAGSARVLSRRGHHSDLALGAAEARGLGRSFLRGSAMPAARKFEDVPSGIKTTRPSNYIYRAGAAHVRAHMLKTTPEGAARELFGNDVVTAEILKAATTPATIGAPGWAGAIAQAAVDDSVLQIATASAAAGLIERGMKIPFDRRASIRVPGRLMDATDAGSW